MNRDAVPALSISHVSLAYAGQPVLNGVSLTLPADEIGCLMGASGSGKSTLLRAVAGFELPSTGSIVLHGTCLHDATTHLPAHRRGVSMVFQDHALFPHLTVQQNIAFGLQKLNPAQRHQRVHELLEMIGLIDTAKRFPHELSGGQQQRVALARALAPRPGLLLLDEPFASLDAGLRKRLALDVRSWLKANKTSALLVTHDRLEAFAFADRVGLLANGCLQQWDTPYRLHHEPVNRLVADFMGEGSWLPAAVVSEHCLRLSLGEFCRRRALPESVGASLQVLVRPDDVIHDDLSPLQARVVHRQFMGSEFLFTLALQDGSHVFSLAPSHHDHAVGSLIGIRIELDHLVAFPA